MAAAPRMKVSQVKVPIIKKTTFHLTNQDEEDEMSYATAKKIMTVNRAVLPIQRKLSRGNSITQSGDAAAGSPGQVNSNSSDCDEAALRTSEREFVPMLNTYRMEPDGKFLPEKTRNLMETILKNRLEGRKYSMAESNELSMSLADEIKAAVRDNAIPDRHKLVCIVYIGQVVGQGVHVTSRCLWKATFDSSSSATFQNDHLFAQASVFAVYVE